MTHEQVVHDRINLVRLVRRLEKSVADIAQPEPQGNSSTSWVRTQGTLQVCSGMIITTTLITQLSF